MAAKVKPKAKTKAPEARPLPAGTEALLDKHDVCAALKIGLRKFAEMRSTGEYPAPSLRLGTLVRWTVADHNAAVAKLQPTKREG